jgi:hypothetical protein
MCNDLLRNNIYRSQKFTAKHIIIDYKYYTFYFNNQ